MKMSISYGMWTIMFPCNKTGLRLSKSFISVVGFRGIWKTWSRKTFRRALDRKTRRRLGKLFFVISNIFAWKKIEAEGQASRSFCHVRFQGLPVFARHLSSPCFIDGEFEANKQKTTVSQLKTSRVFGERFVMKIKKNREIRIFLGRPTHYAFWG